MSPRWSHHEHVNKVGGAEGKEFEDIENGLYDKYEEKMYDEKQAAGPELPPLVYVDNKLRKPLHIDTDNNNSSYNHRRNSAAGGGVLSPMSPIHDGLTPSLTGPVPELALSWPKGWKVPIDAPAGETTRAKKGGAGSPGGKPPKLPSHKGKWHSNVSRWIVFKLWFNTYRKFFTIVTTVNGIGITLAALGKFPYADGHLGALVLGNLLTAIMFRNELWLRFLYVISIHGLKGWAPLSIKLGVTSALQHVGGIHSGSALSGAAWLVYKIIDIVRHASVQHKAVIVMGIITNVLIIISVLSAFPWVRNNHHNVFEKHHRFIGWLGLATTWNFVILGNFYDIKYGEWRVDADSLLDAQEFWFAIFMTVFVLIPWFTLREVPVEVEIPSPKVAILKFDRGMQQGLLGRISRTSIMEYHAFGIISEGKNSGSHYMICGVQGDFTKGLVNDPPKTVWTRELKFPGVGNTSAMYKRGIRICTGTGIGASLSTCIQSKNWFLIWIGSDQEKTFGPTIQRLIHENIEPERMILWDSKQRGGRPDTMKLLRDTWQSFGAEVIFITSNWVGNAEMMQGCAAEGMHAFGTLWDF